MNTHTVVAFTDFSETGEASLHRAASIAAQNSWALQIMFASTTGAPMEPGPIARLSLCSRQLARRYNLAVRAASHVVDTQARLMDATATARLVVAGQNPEAKTSRFWGNTIVDQLVRNCHCPILVVKTAFESPYKRMMVGVGFTPRSSELVNRACEIVPDAEMHLFHAISRSDEARLRSSDASIEAIQAYRRQVDSNANERLFRLADSLDARRNRVMYFVGYGDTALQTSVQQQAVSADLVVVGRQRQSALRELFFGSIARRLVHIVASDVLVVPQGSPAISLIAAPGRRLSPARHADGFPPR